MKRESSQSKKKGPQAASRSRRPPKPKSKCRHCSKLLIGEFKALFVEEEIGRTFCSEECIAAYFSPDVRRLEQEYLAEVSPRDLTAQERERYVGLRWTTLQSPDEVWRQTTLDGDQVYTLIAKFPASAGKNSSPMKPSVKKSKKASTKILSQNSHPDMSRDSVWLVCICLYLRGEPSFLFLAFPTRSAALVEYYRGGTQLQLTVQNALIKAEPPSDRLGTEWSQEETRQAELVEARQKSDIPPEEFDHYVRCFEETLESPDEVWSRGERKISDLRLYHFVRYYPNEVMPMWYVIVAKDTGEDEEIEILDSFPTQDELLVHRYRTGRRELERERDQPTRRVLN